MSETQKSHHSQIASKKNSWNVYPNIGSEMQSWFDLQQQSNNKKIQVNNSRIAFWHI